MPAQDERVVNSDGAGSVACNARALLDDLQRSQDFEFGDLRVA
jgi:hypothetical protein